LEVYAVYTFERSSLANVGVTCYSSTGNVYALAEAVAEGPSESRADVRLRRVAELARPEAIDSNPAWRAHLEATAKIPEAHS
jgi:NAD(P)H dehydrogenase (quinone)